MTPLEDRLRAILSADPIVMPILVAARSLALPDSWIVAGALYQTVWNRLHGFPPGTGMRDIDLIYYDADDLSYEAEDAVIRRAAAALPAGPCPVELRNQARVHLWFEQRFGAAYAPLTSSLEALGRYQAIAHAVAARLDAAGRIEIAAPFGLDDIFAMILRPNPAGDRQMAAFLAKSRRMQAIWPQITIIETLPDGP